MKLNVLYSSYIVIKFQLHTLLSFRLFLNINLNVYYNFTKNCHILVY